MSFLSWLFGTKKENAIIIEPVAQPEPVKSEAELALDKFESDLNGMSNSLDKARNTLYDRKAQLNAMSMALNELDCEIKAHEKELNHVENGYSKAIETERTDLEIRGQKLQNIILRKREQFKAQKASLTTFEKTIDMLEKNVLSSELKLSQKRTRLEAAKTAAAAIELNEEINSNLRLGSIDIDEKGLDVFMERQKLMLEDIDNEIVVVSTSQDDVMTLPFKERMKDVN